MVPTPSTPTKDLYHLDTFGAVSQTSTYIAIVARRYIAIVPRRYIAIVARTYIAIDARRYIAIVEKWLNQRLEVRILITT